ncbi:KH domain-containing protein [Candidatus Uhrbacteria bacterium]|nr:KH domain-containing protein [Candidatus Uhrbacteria bacterium]
MAEQFVEQQFLEFMVKSIVNHPDDVKVERTVDERGVLLTLHVNPEDMGYVIGREGQTARALRILLKIVGAKGNARVNMKIYEPEGARREHQEKKASTSGSSMGGMSMGAPSSMPQKHGDAGLVTDADLNDLGI